MRRIVALAGPEGRPDRRHAGDANKRCFWKRWNPGAVIEIAIEPNRRPTGKARRRAGEAGREDPSFRVDRQRSSEHPKGMGDSSRHQVEILPAHTSRRTSARRRWRSGARHQEAESIPPHEADRGPASSGVKFVVEPNEPGKGFRRRIQVVGGAVPKDTSPRRKGINRRTGSGVVAGSRW